MDTRIVERHEDMSRTGTLKLIMEPDGDVIVVVKPDEDDRMQSPVFWIFGAIYLSGVWWW